MTTNEIIQYYADLLIMQYSEQPKAYDTVEAFVGPVIMDQLPLLVQAAFDVDTAVGVQLDTIGKYVGASRFVYDFTGRIELSDDDYRLLIKLIAVQNNSGSSLAEIQALLHTYFDGVLLVFDYANMRMSYLFNADAGSLSLAQVLVRQELLPKPMGVQLAALIYIADITNLFGFRTYDLPGYNVHGFNSYATYDMDCPWVSYDDAVFL